MEEPQHKPHPATHREGGLSLNRDVITAHSSSPFTISHLDTVHCISPYVIRKDRELFGYRELPRPADGDVTAPGVEPAT